MASALEAFEHVRKSNFALDGLSKLVEGASSVGADELERGVNSLVETLEFAKSPSVQASGKAMMAISGVVASIPMPPVTQIIGGILGAAGAVMSVFGPSGEESNASRQETNASDRSQVSELLGTIDTQVRGLVRGVQEVDKKMDEILQLQRASYKYDVLGGKIRDEIESRYVQLFKNVKNAMQDPSLLDSAVFQAKSAMASVGHSSYAKGALTPTRLKKYLMFVKKTKGGDVAVGHAFQSFIVARFQLFWVVWTATIYIDGKVSLNSEDHMKRLQRHMAEYEGVIKSVLGEDGLNNLLLTNTEIIEFVERAVLDKTDDKRQRRRRPRRRRIKKQKRRQGRVSKTARTAATERTSLFNCPSECQECAFGRSLEGSARVRFTCILKSKDRMPEDRNCTAPKRKQRRDSSQDYADFIATPATPAPIKSEEPVAVKCDFKPDEKDSSAYKLLHSYVASMRAS
jgi:hypothetical protein